MRGARGTASALTSALRNGTVRLPEVIEPYLDRIRKRNDELGALLHVFDEGARSRAQELQRRLDAGDWPGPLTGVPVAIKDNISLAGHPTTAGSRILEGFRPVYTATAVERLEASGAIVIGKANLDEFAMGSSNEYSAYGAARNPYDTGRVPGGSSGGCAAAIAGGLALGALGSDTGGSVRQPAAFCGLVALKPQYGSVSRYGLIAFGSSLDQIGPMARTAGDCAALYNAIRGVDPHDATSLEDTAPVDVEAWSQRPRDVRLGVPRSWLAARLDADVRASFDRCCARFAELGVRVVDVALPDPSWAVATYYILANAEASANLARYDGVRYGPRAAGAASIDVLYAATRGAGFGPEVKRRILLGTYVLSAGYHAAYYARAARARLALRAAYAEVLQCVDALLMPTTPAPAFRLGEKLGDPLAMYLCDVFTIGANLTGWPAVAFPVGRNPAGLPLGAQLCGPPGGEDLLLGLVHRFDGGKPLPLPEG